MKRFLQVPEYPCSLFGAKACSLGQKLLTLRVIYYQTLKLMPEHQAECLLWQGQFYSSSYQKDAVLVSYEQVLGLFRQVGSKLGEANVRKAMGDVQQFRDERDAALASYEQVLGLFRQVGSKLGEANCYLAQGLVALGQEDCHHALALHSNAYQLYHQIQDGYSQTRLLYYRSFVYEAMKEPTLALQDVNEALLIAQQISLPLIDTLQQRLDILRGS